MIWLAALLADESGGTTVEYALVSATLAVLVIAALASIAAKCSTELGNTSNMTSQAASPP